MLRQQRRAPGLKILHILQHHNDAFHAANAVEDRRRRYDTHARGPASLTKVLIILQTGDAPFLLNGQIEHAHVQHVAEVPHIHLQIFLTGNIAPIDHRRVDEQNIACSAVDHHAHINIVQDQRKQRGLREIVE